MLTICTACCRCSSPKCPRTLIATCPLGRVMVSSSRGHFPTDCQNVQICIPGPNLKAAKSKPIDDQTSKNVPSTMVSEYLAPFREKLWGDREGNLKAFPSSRLRPDGQGTEARPRLGFGGRIWAVFIGKRAAGRPFCSGQESASETGKRGPVLVIFTEIRLKVRQVLCAPSIRRP